jgi:hypothetical protein
MTWEPGIFEKDELCLNDNTREKGEERLEGVLRAVHRGKVFRKTAAFESSSVPSTKILLTTPVSLTPTFPILSA